jgi:hypothetical protein
MARKRQKHNNTTCHDTLFCTFLFIKKCVTLWFLCCGSCAESPAYPNCLLKNDYDFATEPLFCEFVHLKFISTCASGPNKSAIGSAPHVSPCHAVREVCAQQCPHTTHNICLPALSGLACGSHHPSALSGLACGSSGGLGVAAVLCSSSSFVSVSVCLHRLHGMQTHMQMLHMLHRHV